MCEHRRHDWNFCYILQENRILMLFVIKRWGTTQKDRGQLAPAYSHYCPGTKRHENLVWNVCDQWRDVQRHWLNRRDMHDLIDFSAALDVIGDGNIESIAESSSSVSDIPSNDENI